MKAKQTTEASEKRQSKKVTFNKINPVTTYLVARNGPRAVPRGKKLNITTLDF